MSLNGFIAKENGDENFISHDNWQTLVKLSGEFGNIVIGRKTYEAVKNWGEDYSFNDLKNVKKVVISRQDLNLDDGYILAKSPEEALEILKKENFENVLVTGGPIINSSFINLNLLDEIMINVEPAVVGKGIGLFYPDDFEKKLSLIDNKTLDNGIVQLYYEVIK